MNSLNLTSKLVHQTILVVERIQKFGVQSLIFQTGPSAVS